MAVIGTGMAQTGNAVSPWSNEAERKAANNSALAPYGLSADANYNLFDANKNYVAPKIGADGMGGVYNPQGMSNNPYFLQGTIGIDRSQLAGTGLENVSDRALNSAYTSARGLGTGMAFANDLWVNADGSMSSVRGQDSVSVGDIRKALTQLTGQQNTDAWGAAAPLVKPDYYDGKNLNTASMGQRQQDLISQLTKQTIAAYNAATGVKPTETPNPTTGGTTAPTQPVSGLDEDELRRYIASLLKAGGKW